MVACTNPATNGQLSSGDPEGAFSCVAYSYGYASCDASHGSVHETGETIRNWTGDHRGGLELQQCDIAVTAHTDLEFDTTVTDWPTLKSRHNNGEGAVLIGGYEPISVSRFSGQPTFKKDHGIYLPPGPGWKVMDPLADGRRAGIYKYDAASPDDYGETLVHDFTSALILSNGKLAGPNHVEASFVKVPPHVPVPVPPPLKHWRMSITAGRVAFWPVNTATGRAFKPSYHVTGGFSAFCSAPHLYKYGTRFVRLIQITDPKSGYNHTFINVSNPHLTLKEV